MIEKMEKVPPKIRVLITVSSIIIILAVVIFISNDLFRARKAKFISSVEDTLSMYGNSIDHYSIDYAYVGVYVNSRQWNNTSEETKDAFMKEVYALVRIDAINADNLKGNVITLAFYDGKERVSLYQIKE